MAATVNARVNYPDGPSKIHTLDETPTVGEPIRGETVDDWWFVGKVELRDEEVEGVPISFEVWAETDPNFDPDARA